ncbi:MAG: bifunctional demethylmenaquinone methyltransferase/2-methoxy-6-polyprenyl-1,4-benzoquinol methylase UbiE [Bacteroidetes bacterium]|nr:bifunctional demethylmenaquinone methyltransferase/2-methoxy-6-polyprenyl-1,4-benzoquinol methylase UbiE [Bacteroidota bacterium]
MVHQHDTITPYAQEGKAKKAQVAEMFDNISHRYDFLNHFLSLGIDITWRRKAIRMLRPLKPKVVVDIATGTGDFAIEAARLKPGRIIGLDISEGMLAVGRQKVARRKLSGLIEMVQADSEALPYPDNFCQAVTVGFGVRNFEDLDKGLREIHRILSPGGVCIILEPAVPRRFPTRQLVLFYYKTLLPLFGRLFSKDPRAYSYLPETIQAFPHGPQFLDICQKTGFSQCKWKPLTLGICALYYLEK